MSTLAYVFASVDYANNKTQYGVMTLLGKNLKKIGVYNPLVDSVEMGLWDGKQGSEVCFAYDPCESMADLVKEIAKGVKQFKEHNMMDFIFSFEYPDNLNVSFFKKDDRYTALENILVRERPLNEQEREQFARAFAALSNKKE